MRKDIPTYLYLNFSCDSDCRFCASDETNTLKHYSDFDINKIKSIFCDKYFIERNSSLVIVSGGEPTVHPDILPILNQLNSKFRLICLMTNGVKLSNSDFFKSVIDSGTTNYSVPVYGDKKTHNYLTRRRWYDKTMAFVRNAMVLKQSNTKLHLDIKLLFTKFNYECNPLLAKNMTSEFGNSFSYSLNGLFRSRKSINENMYIPLYKVSKHLTDTISTFYDYNIPIRLSYVPLCSIEKSVLKDIIFDLYAQTLNDSKYVYYVRPDSDDIKLFANKHYEPTQCKECDVYEICSKFSGINAHYFDQDPVFPVKL